MKMNKYDDYECFDDSDDEEDSELEDDSTFTQFFIGNIMGGTL